MHFDRTWLRIDEFKMPSASDASERLGFPRDNPRSAGLMMMSTALNDGPQPLKHMELVEYLVNNITSTFGNRPTWRFIEVEFTYSLDLRRTSEWVAGVSPVGYMAVPLVRGFIKRLHELVFWLIHGYGMRVLGHCVMLNGLIIDATRVRGSINIKRINVYRTAKKLRGKWSYN